MSVHIHCIIFLGLPWQSITSWEAWTTGINCLSVLEVPDQVTGVGSFRGCEGESVPRCFPRVCCSLASLGIPYVVDTSTNHCFPLRVAFSMWCLVSIFIFCWLTKVDFSLIIREIHTYLENTGKRKGRQKSSESQSPVTVVKHHLLCFFPVSSSCSQIRESHTSSISATFAFWLVCAMNFPKQSLSQSRFQHPHVSAHVPYGIMKYGHWYSFPSDTEFHAINFFRTQL